MARYEIGYNLDGDVFTGLYEILGSGDSTEVSVQFDGNSISAVAGQLGAEVVARTLLGELVREKRTLGNRWPSFVAEPGLEDCEEGLHYRYGHDPESRVRA